MLLPLVTLVVAQLFDLGTFVAMVRRYGVAAEGNPIVAALFADHGTAGVALAKIGLVVFVAALAVLSARLPRRTRLATVIIPVAVAIVAGLVGGLSNAVVILG